MKKWRTKIRNLTEEKRRKGLYLTNNIIIKNEIKRLDKAVKNAVSDLGKIIKKIKDHKNDIYGEMKFMLEANISIISSSSLVTDAKKRIHSDLINAEFAVIEELNKHSKIFKKIMLLFGF